MALSITTQHLIDVSDLGLIRFECGTCNGAFTVQIATMAGPIDRCLNCGQAWLPAGDQSPEAQSMTRLLMGLKQAILAATAQSVPYRLKFEIGPRG